ncbi:hypothetical protein [Sorangium sp. So ce1389]|uniref:hypothetical protein n=1 Tax=Sorangium sp. So ce1389 TaxID=3133336 RepID=UPI003F5FDBAA
MRRSFWSTAALAVASAGCSAPVTGELMVAIQTDMAVTKDLDHIELHVLSGGNPVISGARYRLGPNDVALPATQGLLVSEDPSREISIRVRAIRHDRPRVEHTVLTTVPSDRVATLWVPLHFLCSADEASWPGAPGACPDDLTCVAGACRDPHVSAASLPDYVEEEVLRRACFDVSRCFRSADPAEDLDAADCTIAAGDDVNVAIATEGEGACGGAGCFVPLDAESDFGWHRRDDRRIALPEALCSPERLARLGVVTSPVTAECPAKRIGDPLCAVDESQPVVLAARQRSPISLAVSEESVFWTEQGALSGPDGFKGDGAVKRIPREGGAPETLAPGQAAPRQLALDGASGGVLWTNRGVGAGKAALMRRSLDRDDAVALLSEQQLQALGPSGALEGLATNDRHLFWTQLSGTGVRGLVGRASLDGQTGVTLSEPFSANRIAAASNVVCWTDLGQDDTAPDAVDDTGAVWCLKSGEAMPVKVADRQRKPYGIALDATNASEVFWVNLGGEVVRGAVDGDAPEVIFEDHDHPGPYGIALDEDRVYWTNLMQGTVSTLPRDAPPNSDCRGDRCTLATGQRRPGAIAVDAGAIYWVNEGSPGEANGAVVRLAKPPPP